ncbi:MAG TPA: phosphatase PAP2 family protein, partial [Gammaproteobacteria bacterium]|nr:phosphatase PAP2 family protein [Gammaproteobacteria bacterium]
VRPLLPAGRFFAVNTLSALLWAPAYILPGVLFGASLDVAAEIAGRLALLLVILLVLLWFSWWLVRRVTRSLQPHAQAAQLRVLQWARRYPRIEPLAASLLDPEHPEARGMTVLTGLLIVASAAFLMIVWHLTPDTLLGNLDLYLFNWLQKLRSPLGDRLMIGITELGNGEVLYGFTGVLCLVLLWQRHWRAAVHWLVTVAGVALLTYGLKAVTAVQRPPVPAITDMSFSFPSGHASISVAVYGFLAVILARELRRSWHWLAYATAVFLIVAIGFSRLYLGVHWLSDVLGGWSLGVAWVAVMGIAYRQHPSSAISVRVFAPLSLAVLAGLASLYHDRHFEQDLARYVPPSSVAATVLNEAEWLAGGWRKLPAYRDDLEGLHTQPLDLQWLGRLQDIEALLLSRGWRRPRVADVTALMGLLNSEAAIDTLPVLPQVHHGRTQDLLLVRDLPDKHRLLALRLWKTDFCGNDPQRVLSVGNVSYLYLEERLRLLRFLRTARDFNGPLALLQQDLEGLQVQRVQRRENPPPEHKTEWDGTVLLVTGD